ncbi:hypothetical protein C8F04DRAFT_1317339 [Mycena alexandri]|uniref:Uncharacterized protein n=1 Tax=Mycena alexandri TaxID=1745969 RepID=A0AAD6T816_9AGAR|nr:hypothetical protein C8F04DRAFT_1317339 [Mycena alexandri]
MKNTGTPWAIKSSRTLSLILRVLKLERLSVEAKPKLKWELMTRSLRAALRDATPGLEVLHLRGITTSAANELFFMISQAEGLKSPSISYQMRRRMITNLTLAPDWRPQLRALAFSDHYTSAQFARASSGSQLDFSNLRSLSFSGLNSPAISAFLKALPQENVAGSLRIWTLRVRAPFGLSIFRQILEECTNTDLEKIAFEGHATDLRQAPRFESEQWERFVAAIRQSPVTRVHFLVSGQIGLESSVQRYRSTVEEALALVAGEDAVSRLPLCPPTRRRT